jgi:Uma2 family endonuclease
MLTETPTRVPVALPEAVVMPSAAHRRLFSAAEYYTMLAAGILHEDDRVELIEGEIVEMSPINFAHAGQVTCLMELLAERLGKQAAFSPQNPIDLGDSQPQPDIAVLAPPANQYRRAHPKPEQVLWVVEVSDSTLTYDRTVKAPLYAKHGIPEVWVVNLTERCVEQFLDPTRKGYRTHRHFWAGDELTSLSPAVIFRVDDILG